MKITKNIAYLRVSTAEQDLEKNKLAILKLAHDKNLGQVTFVEEKISGKVPDEKLDEPFVKEQYGSCRRNIEGMIEYCYYHLGQISLIKKLLSSPT